MTVAPWGQLAWPQLRDRQPGPTVAILPLGAVEAHGPHLPLITDGIIAEAMAEDAARRLRSQGLDTLVLPSFDYAPAPFAAAFAGTLSIRPATLRALLVDVAAALRRTGVETLGLANAHLDPAHLGAIAGAAGEIDATGGPSVAFADLTRRRWAERLTEEFRSGACHAGRYETSVVLSERPDLVCERTRAGLEANPRSLVTAIRQGLTSFEEAGGPEAYFGDPRAASAAEGRQTVGVLGKILADCVLEVRATDGASAAGSAKG